MSFETAHAQKCQTSFKVIHVRTYVHVRAPAQRGMALACRHWPARSADVLDTPHFYSLENSSPRSLTALFSRSASTNNGKATNLSFPALRWPNKHLPLSVCLYCEMRHPGTGAYGQVCEAKLDELPCAAKLLHSILVEQQAQEPGHVRAGVPLSQRDPMASVPEVNRTAYKFTDLRAPPFFLMNNYIY